MANFLEIIIFILPAYIANSIPVVLGGGMPLDLEKKFSDGRRIFGNGKTMRGFLSGILGGTVTGGILAIAYPISYFSSIEMQFIASFALALGTMIGDAFGSFIKRRMGIESGRQFFLDTVMFIVLAMIFAYPFVIVNNAYTIENIVIIVLMTIIIHPLTNIFANRIGLKNVPW
ncbi:MAG: CDP-2,3-bis-(O-geranylgeranyl)-sn-glycerol synthase [Candidatus Micrarchaeota archaeon]|nr:CDP-2,3-bis-(O-geranylgeranyl)-sn-glycerol synthase [Candidatus Micrarchaeota archaeon]